MTDDLGLQLSIRTASWVAAQCVRCFCRQRGLAGDPRLDAFSSYLEDAATAEDIPSWFESASSLQVSGLGDPLPPDLDSIPDLNLLLGAAHEVSATQIYAAWRPAEVSRFLRQAVDISGLDVARTIDITALREHDPGLDGWGAAVDETTRQGWRRES